VVYFETDEEEAGYENKPVNWLAVWVLNTWKYLASCWLLNKDRCGERHTGVEGDCICGTTGTNFTLRWIALSSSPSYPSQPRPTLRQRWQLGRVSSHLTLRILKPTTFSLSCICVAGNEEWCQKYNWELTCTSCNPSSSYDGTVSSFPDLYPLGLAIRLSLSYLNLRQVRP
jgi:hypothetical protein